MPHLYRFSCAALLVLAFSSVASGGQGSVQGLTLSHTTVEAGTTVRATATGTSPCGAVHIDWGDGTAITYPTETLPVTQTHVYQSGGTFNLRVQGWATAPARRARASSSRDRRHLRRRSHGSCSPKPRCNQVRPSP